MKLHLLVCVAMLAGCGAASTVDIEVSDSGTDSGEGADALPSNPFADSGNDSGADTSIEVDSSTQDAGQDSSESICVTSSPEACQEQVDSCEEYDHYPVTVCVTSYYLCMYDWTAQCGNPAQACGYLCMEKYEGCMESYGNPELCQNALTACSNQCQGVNPTMDAGYDAATTDAAIQDADDVTDADDSGRHHHDHDAMTHGCGH